MHTALRLACLMHMYRSDVARSSSCEFQQFPEIFSFSNTTAVCWWETAHGLSTSICICLRTLLPWSSYSRVREHDTSFLRRPTDKQQQRCRGSSTRVWLAICALAALKQAILRHDRIFVHTNNIYFEKAALWYAEF